MSRVPTQPTRYFVWGKMVLACTALCVMWEDAYSIDARLEKNRGVGVGFGMLPEGDQTLTITLHAPPDGWLIDESEPRDNSGDHAWQPADGITTDSATHVYTVIGVDPNDGHAVGFCGKLKKAVEGDGSPPTFDAAVADLDLDAEGVEDDDEATAPGGGLFVPRSMHKGADFPDTLGEDDQYATLTLSVRPKWAGPPNPEYVGTLTFDVTGDGIQLYDISVNPPKIAERSRSVPAEGLTVQYGVVTNDQATSPGDIGATFTWDSELQGGPATAVDHVRIVPYWVDLDVARLEGNTVVQSEEDTQGSITSIVGPNDNLDTYALNLPRVAISSIEVLAEFGNPNGVRLYFEKVNPAASPGKVRIIKNSAVWMTDSESSKELSLADLSQTFTAQATYGGGVDLRLVARISGAAVCSDRVRISAIPGAVPKPGRIVFVNPAATNHNPPYDDFLENASENLSDAVFVATSGDNVVVAREYTFKFSSQLTVQKSAIVLAGLAGRLISPPNPNPYPWTTDEMDWSQRLPHLSGQGTTAILYWPNVSDVQVAGFVFENANATRGAACRFDESSNVSILCSQFSDNQAPDGGAGIMWRFTHQSRVLGCLFLRNTQTSSEESLGGGAILLQGCNTSSVARCRFEDRNTAAHGGAGVCLYSCPNSTVLTSYFTDCHGKFGGGVLVKDALDPLLPKSRIITCVFKENVYTAAQPHHGGSGVYVEDASCLISGCDFVNNSHAGSGGAIACRGDSTIEIGQLVEIHSCHFTQNHADYCGGAIAVFGSAEEGLSCDPPAIWGGTDANIIECQFDGNSCRTKGGAVVVTAPNSSVAILGASTVFRNNTANGGSASETRGGAIACCAIGGVYVTGATFENNACDFNGGAVYHTTLGAGEYTNCSFVSNAAVNGDGGAVHATCGGDVTLTDCIVGTRAGPNSAINGGGIDAANAEVRMSGASTSTSRVAYNTASQQGGGVRLIKPVDTDATSYVGVCTYLWSTFEAERTAINCNTAALGGGIYGRRDANTPFSDYEVYLQQCLIQGNSASSGINGTSADGLYYVHHPDLLPAIISAEYCTFAQHASAAITINAYDQVPDPIYRIYFWRCNVGDNDVGLTTYASSTWVKYCTFDSNTRGGKKTHVLIRASGSLPNYDLSVTYSDFISNGTQLGFDIDKSGSAALNVNECNIEGFTQGPVFHGVLLRNLEFSPLGAIYEIDCLDCYWGSASGPLDSSDDTISGGDYNPSGAGSHVSDGADYRYPIRTSRVSW